MICWIRRGTDPLAPNVKWPRSGNFSWETQVAATHIKEVNLSQIGLLCAVVLQNWNNKSDLIIVSYSLLHLAFWLVGIVTVHRNSLLDITDINLLLIVSVFPAPFLLFPSDDSRPWLGLAPPQWSALAPNLCARCVRRPSVAAVLKKTKKHPHPKKKQN